MKRYFEENWREMVASFAEGMKWGILAAILVLILFAMSELTMNTEAALTIVRDLRGELRSAVGSKEGTEE